MYTRTYTVTVSNPFSSPQRASGNPKYRTLLRQPKELDPRSESACCNTPLLTL